VLLLHPIQCSKYTERTKLHNLLVLGAESEDDAAEGFLKLMENPEGEAF
jgi:hypothetical protein